MQFKMSAKQSEAWPTIERESDTQSERDSERERELEKRSGMLASGQRFG